MRYDELPELIERIIRDNISYDDGGSCNDPGEADVHTMVTEIVELVKTNFNETA